MFFGVRYPVLFPRWAGFQNYWSILHNSAFRLACWNTLRFVGVCIPSLLAISLLLAVFLQRLGRLGGILKTAFLFPMAIPVASVALVWRVLFENSGLWNSLLCRLGAVPEDWMNSPAAFWVLCGSYLWKNLGYDIVLWMAGSLGNSHSDLRGRPGRLEPENGKSSARLLFPSLLPSLYTISVPFLPQFFQGISLKPIWWQGIIQIQSMYLLQHLFNNWFRDLSFDKLSAGAVLVAAVILGLILLLQRIWNWEE